jgi:predicted metal-dependent phosphotriesterase family hydrolase
VPGILAALSAFGYDQARLDEGVALLNEAWARHAAQKQAYGAQYAATQALRQARQAANELYRIHRRLTSLVLLASQVLVSAIGREHLLPKLRAAGVDEATLRQLTHTNPFRAFAR